MLSSRTRGTRRCGTASGSTRSLALLERTHYIAMDALSFKSGWIVREPTSFARGSRTTPGTSRGQKKTTYVCPIELYYQQACADLNIEMADLVQVWEAR